jgi:hypothetical protein
MIATHRFITRGLVGYKEGRNWVIWQPGQESANIWDGGPCRVTDSVENSRLDNEASEEETEMEQARR